MNEEVVTKSLSPTYPCLYRWVRVANGPATIQGRRPQIAACAERPARQTAKGECRNHDETLNRRSFKVVGFEPTTCLFHG